MRKKVENPIGRVLGRSNNNANANAGVAYSSTNNAASNSNTNNGGRLCSIETLLLVKAYVIGNFQKSIVATAYTYGIGDG
jgi:hypothetical protein